jgi:hypothetical protein
VTDQTQVAGSWDFSFRYAPRGSTGGQATSLFGALEKQLGLKLEPSQASIPVIVVDSVDRRPTDNLPEIAKMLPPVPEEFEVADVKRSAPGTTGSRFRIMPGGRIDAQGTLKSMIKSAWGLNDVMIAGMPPFAETDSWDIIAKAPEILGEDGGRFDADSLRRMLRNLLASRSKLAVHVEERPIMGAITNLTNHVRSARLYLWNPQPCKKQSSFSQT